MGSTRRKRLIGEIRFGICVEIPLIVYFSHINPASQLETFDDRFSVVMDSYQQLMIRTFLTDYIRNPTIEKKI